jgi:glycosyltransferase involved in cell wall biosynthesis
MPWDQIAECIVVDNGSTDGTAEVAAAAGARVVHSPRGYGAACKAGSEAALASSTILVYMDGDGSDVISDLPRLVAPIERDEADFTIGSRIRGNAENRRHAGQSNFCRAPLWFAAAHDPRRAIHRHGSVSCDSAVVL